MTRKQTIFLFLACSMLMIGLTNALSLRYKLYPFNFYETEEFKWELDEKIQQIHTEHFIIPAMQRDLENLVITDEERQVLRHQIQETFEGYYSSSPYDSYTIEDHFNLYSYALDETHEKPILDEISDALLDEFITLQKEEALLEQMETLNYSNTFYYTIEDETGKSYTNITEESDYIGFIKIFSHELKPSLQLTNHEFSGHVMIPTDGNIYVLKLMIKHYLDIFAFFLSLAISFASGIYLYKFRKQINFEQLNVPSFVHYFYTRFQALPLEIKVISLSIIASFVTNFNFNFNRYYFYNMSDCLWYLFVHALYGLAVLFLMLTVQSIIGFCKTPQRFKDELNNSLFFSGQNIAKLEKPYRTIFIYIALYFAVIGAWGSSLGIDEGWIVISLGLMLILLLIIYLKTRHIQRIFEAIHLMANGEKPDDLNLKGKGLLQKVATDINTIKDGVTLTEKKQSQSERLKTELITNVSHDLRTPLTSILNYVDLARRDDITEEERNTYLEILDRKSKRLKLLIDDLFEASKMASGAIELQKTTVNLNALLQQSIGEYEDRLQKASLSVRLSLPHNKAYACADAKKLFRVFENLLSNICKYSQPNTRVYIEMIEQYDHLIISFKNMASYELGFEVTELSERFKRADVSRHTEGSGLGLAIVKSILDLHEASLQLDQDADLFKVTISLPKQ